MSPIENCHPLQPDKCWGLAELGAACRTEQQPEVAFLHSIVDTLRGRRSDSKGSPGNVLLPVDSSGMPFCLNDLTGVCQMPCMIEPVTSWPLVWTAALQSNPAALVRQYAAASSDIMLYTEDTKLFHLALKSISLR